MDKIILIVGASGSGKDYIADRMCQLGKLRKLLSNTTRQPRENEKNTHRFTDIDNYMLDKANDAIVAETKYNGNYYWSTPTAIEFCDVYIVDEKGYMQVKKHKNIKSIGVYVKSQNTVQNMLDRGDSKFSILQRIIIDTYRKLRYRINYDYVIDSHISDKKILDIIEEYEEL